MKKILLFAGVLFIAGSFMSCKKDYTCECTVNGIALPAAEIKDASSKDAKDACNALETAAKMGDPAASCKLK